MANELENTNGSTEQSTNKNSEQTVDTKDLEARIKALEAENGKLRQANTNASAEASKYKKQYNELLPEKDRLEKEKEEHDAAMQKELAELKAERNIAKYTSALVANDIGMDAETAKSVAEALNANEIEQVFDGIRKFITAHDKSLRESALRNNQTLQGGGSTKSVTREEFKNMGYREMLQFKLEHPEQYAEFTKK